MYGLFLFDVIGVDRFYSREAQGPLNPDERCIYRPGLFADKYNTQQTAKADVENRRVRSAERSAMKGKVISINISGEKGVRKKPVKEAFIKTNYGIEGDAHASEKWHRQVSLLALESIRKMQSLGLNVCPGDFAENITTEGIDLLKLPLGTKMAIGNTVKAEVSQIGKECHTRCEIYKQAGDCVMPKEGIFVRVLKGGKIKVGDIIMVRSKAEDLQ